MVGGGWYYCVGYWLGLGFWFCFGGLLVGGELLYYVFVCFGGYLVNGYLCGDGGGGVYWVGLVDENG